MITLDNVENMALNENVETENNETATPTVEQTAEETSNPQTESAEEEKGIEGETEPEEPKKGFSNRVRELNARAKRAEAQVESLSQKLASLTGTQDTDELDFIPDQVSDEPLVRPDEEIDALELDRRLRLREQKVLQRADALVRLRGKQSEAINRINSETVEVLKKYPELDPESPSFNKELSDAITEATEAHVKGAPYSASVKSFVDKMMRPYKGAVSKEVGEMTATVAKQVSQVATRPTSVRKQEKPASDKSIAELEAELGVVQA